MSVVNMFAGRSGMHRAYFVSTKNDSCQARELRVFFGAYVCACVCVCRYVQKDGEAETKRRRRGRDADGKTTSKNSPFALNQSLEAKAYLPRVYMPTHSAVAGGPPEK